MARLIKAKPGERKQQNRENGKNPTGNLASVYRRLRRGALESHNEEDYGKNKQQQVQPRSKLLSGNVDEEKDITQQSGQQHQQSCPEISVTAALCRGFHE